MTAARDLLRAARDGGLSLDVIGDDLVVEVDRDLPAALLAELRDHKAALISLLKEDRPAWAEAAARLDANRPPVDMPLGRWQTFVQDIRRFRSGPFCASAATLGWSPLDLFGCDRDKPIERVDMAGLLWALHGDKLIALTADTATIETRTGARHTYWRNSTQRHRVLAWELPGA